MSNTHRHIRFFKDIGIGDVPRVGGKSASLGEMFQALSAQGVRVPNGFAIVADAYRYMLERAGAVPAGRRFQQECASIRRAGRWFAVRSELATPYGVFGHRPRLWIGGSSRATGIVNA